MEYQCFGCPIQTGKRSLPSHQMGQEDQHLLGDLSDPLVPLDHLLLWVPLIQALPGNNSTYKSTYMTCPTPERDALDPLSALGLHTLVHTYNYYSYHVEFSSKYCLHF